LLGSADAGGWRRTSKPASRAPLPGPSSPISAASQGGWRGREIPPSFMGQTLRHARDLRPYSPGYRACSVICDIWG
jgi:hypothetical protein